MQSWRQVFGARMADEVGQDGRLWHPSQLPRLTTYTTQIESASRKNVKITGQDRSADVRWIGLSQSKIKRFSVFSFLSR